MHSIEIMIKCVALEDFLIPRKDFIALFIKFR